MQAFLVEMENRPGELASIAEELGRGNINITGISGATWGQKGRLAVMTSDPTGTATALRDGGYTFEEVEVVETSMRDEPGTLGRAARRLADANVNIEALLPIGRSGDEISVGFITDDPVAAREALSRSAATG